MPRYRWRVVGLLGALVVCAAALCWVLASTPRQRTMGLAALALGYTAAAWCLLKVRRFPFLRKRWRYAIGIYTGTSPFDCRESFGIPNPVLTYKDVTDVRADFVADPFMLRVGPRWHMFFEVWNHDSGKGEIGLATSADGMVWHYEKIVLVEPFCLSYPFVFEWEGQVYMTPECSPSGTVRLYRADPFPERWTLAATLFPRAVLVDPTLFRFDDRWWLFASTREWDQLFLYHAPDLAGPWTAHAKNPIIAGNAHIARPGGRVIRHDGRLYRFAQDDAPTYGNQVHAFEITVLSPSQYEEVEIAPSPILAASGRGWNGEGMHTIDPHPIGPSRWIAAVDGLGWQFEFGWQASSRPTG